MGAVLDQSHHDAQPRRTRSVSRLRDATTLTLLVAAIAVPWLRFLHVPPVVTIALAVLVSSWLPGSVITRFLLHMEHVRSRDAMAFAISLTISFAMALALATTPFLHFPGALTVAWYLGMVLPHAVLFARYLRSAGYGEPDPGRHLGDRFNGPPWPQRMAAAAVDRSVWILVASTLAWAVGLALSNADTLGPYGLLPTYNLAYWVGLLTLAVWLTHRALRRSAAHDTVLWWGLVSLTFALHVPGILLNSAPRFTWLYKHVGVVDYITAHGTVDPQIDVYHNWPGFFAYSSWLNQLSGADSLSYAAWTPIAVNLSALFLCSALYTEFGISPAIRRMGLLLVLVANWIGQDYFAPQAMAYLMHISFVLCCVVGFGLGRLRGFVRLPRFLAPVPINPGLPPVRHGGRRSLGILVVMLFASWVIVATHQLTPLFLFATLGLAAVLGLWRTWRVTLIGGAVLVAYTLWHLRYVKDKYDVGINVNPFKNAGGTTENLVTITSQGAVDAGRASVFITAMMFGLAAAGILIGLRRGLPVVNQTMMAVAPLVVFLVQSYGGEALYRVVLFAQVGLAPLAAIPLVVLATMWHSRASWIPAALAVVALVVAFQPAHYANERVLRVTRGEVAAAEWLSQLPSGAIIYYAIDAFPARGNERYVDHVPGKGQYDPVLTRLVPGLTRGSTPSSSEIVRQVRAVMRETTPKGACSYVTFSPTMLAQVQTYGPHTPQQYEAVKRAVRGAREFSTIYDRDGVLVMKNNVAGEGPPIEVPGVRVEPQTCGA